MSKPLNTSGFIAAAFVLMQYGSALAWEPPIGIPRPEFGIEQTHYMYEGQAGYSDAGNGPYTHYVDNSSACTDSGNSNGSPSNPRCSVPNSLPAGSVVEIHGDLYPYTSGIRAMEWRMNGTVNQPVFIRGVSLASRPEFRGKRIELTGTYGIIEYIEVNEAGVEFPGPSDHIALRHSHVHHHPGTGSIVANLNGTFIVIYNNEINSNGVNGQKPDRNGIFLGSRTDHVWIVDSHIHHHKGDAIAFCHTCIGDGNGPTNVFIGRNYIHDDEENGLDLKEFIGPVVISENIIRNYMPTSTSRGDAIRVNDEGDQGDVWIIFNDISNSALGIEPEGSKATVYIIGNILHNISNIAIDEDADFVINNTIYDVADAIVGDETKGNIIFNASADAIGLQVTGCSHNLISGGRLQRTCTNTVTGDPKFIFDVNNQLLGIQQDSPAIGSGISNHSVYDTFQARFGINIRVDANGTPRPVGLSWSAGAHEFLNSSLLPKPPSGLTVIQ